MNRDIVVAVVTSAQSLNATSRVGQNVGAPVKDSLGKKETLSCGSRTV